MEHPSSQFIDREQREHIEFYQSWVKDVLQGNIAGVDDLIALRNRFTLDTYDQRVAYDMGLDTDMLEVLLEEINSKIKGRILETTEELLGSVFHAKLFTVGVQTGEGIQVVESLEIRGDGIVPVINGEPYEGPINDVFFDR